MSRIARRTPRSRGLPRRLAALPPEPVARASLAPRRAVGARARVLGLAGLASIPVDAGLLLPRTRSVHTVGMRFALDLAWLDASGRIVRLDVGVGPGRLRACRAAHAVLELPAGGADRHRLAVGDVLAPERREARPPGRASRDASD